MAVLEGLTELLQFSAAVSNSSDSSNCHDYRPFDIGSGFSQQLTRDSAHLGTNISLCINIQIQNCSNSKVFVLSVPGKQNKRGSWKDSLLHCLLY